MWRYKSEAECKSQAAPEHSWEWGKVHKSAWLAEEPWSSYICCWCGTWNPAFSVEERALVLLEGKFTLETPDAAK